MPLDHYGVLIGTLTSFTRDPVHDFGKWYHGHVQLDAAGTAWTSALDVDAPKSVGVAYRLVTDLTTGDLGPVAGMAPGFHLLDHAAGSGALDYLRSDALRNGFLVTWLRAHVLSSGAPAGWAPPPPTVGLPGGPVDADFGPAPYEPDPIDSSLEKWLHFTHRIPIKLLRPLPGLRWRSFPWVTSNGDNALDALAPYLSSATT